MTSPPPSPGRNHRENGPDPVRHLTRRADRATRADLPGAVSARMLIRRWIVPGLGAGTAFLAVAVITGAATRTAWAMPEGIGHLLGVGVADYRLQPAPFVAGVAVHLVVSTALGTLFILIARSLRLRRRAVLVAGAILFATVESTVVIHLVLPALASHSDYQFFVGASPLWASIVGHTVYGKVLGTLVVRAPATVPATATSHSPAPHYTGGHSR